MTEGEGFVTECVVITGEFELAVHTTATLC